MNVTVSTTMPNRSVLENFIGIFILITREIGFDTHRVVRGDLVLPFCAAVRFGCMVTFSDVDLNRFGALTDARQTCCVSKTPSPDVHGQENFF